MPAPLSVVCVLKTWQWTQIQPLDTSLTVFTNREHNRPCLDLLTWIGLKCCAVLKALCSAEILLVEPYQFLPMSPHWKSLKKLRILNLAASARKDLMVRSMYRWTILPLSDWRACLKRQTLGSKMISILQLACLTKIRSIYAHPSDLNPPKIWRQFSALTFLSKVVTVVQRLVTK